jgi:hydroxyacyl-ACP dehydratase HTD2-like protein with hotdog domain
MSGLLETFDASAWVGRSASTRVRATRETVALLELSLDRRPPADGEALAPLRHWLWLFAPPAAPTAALGEDGHSAGSPLIPDWPLPRRMWASSDVHFLAAIATDTVLERQTTVESVTVKRGRSGLLGFLVQRHRWLLPDGRCAIDDAQTAVYREPVPPGRPAGAAVAPPCADGLAADWETAHRPGEILLFRYSALSFNAHRIHYDLPYVTGVEGYPGLVVHGPLMATLMLDAFRDAHPGRRVRRFSFRALAPAFAGAPIRCGGRSCGPGRAQVWVRDAAGGDHLAGAVEFD